MTHRPEHRPSFRDTPERYGWSRALHWTMAGLILWQLLGMGLRLVFGRQPFVTFFVGSHQAVGTVLFGLILARAAWALANRRHRPAHGAGVTGLAARAGHGLLYALMLIIPGVALLRAYGNDRVFAPFGFTVFPAREEPIGWMVDLAGALHGELGWVLAAMVAGHVIMVGLHEGMWRDGTLARMAGSGRRRAAGGRA